MTLGAYFASAGAISISNLQTGAMTQINGSILSSNVEYTSEMASQLSFDVIDFDLSMYNRGYFDVGRDVVYTTETALDFDSFISDDDTGFNTDKKFVNIIFEIANVTVGEGPGNSPLVQVKCYSKAVQQMKRDRNPSKIPGNGTDFVKNAARRYGLRCFAEKTNKAKKINKATGDRQAESLWDVLSSLADEAKFLLFESDGVLFFASEKFLLNRWGTQKSIVPTNQKKKGSAANKVQRFVPIVNRNFRADVFQFGPSDFEVYGRPSITKSANDPRDADGTLNLARHNAIRLRPGMTIRLFNFSNRDGYPDLDGSYLINQVSFSNSSPDPVSISFKKPEPEKAKDIKDLRVGARYISRATTSQTGEAIFRQLGKNSKQVRSKSNYDIIKTITGSIADELPRNLVDDPRVLPLPTINSRFVFPRYDAAELLQSGTSASLTHDMYSMPIANVGGRPTTVYLATIENVVQYGFNNNNPFTALVSLIKENASTGAPELIEVSSASTWFINASTASVSSASFIGKFATSSAAGIYEKLLRTQQDLVLASRFRTTTLPECSIYPLPTSGGSASVGYPYMGSGLISKGNVHLYNRPVKIENGEAHSLYPHVFSLFDPTVNDAATTPGWYTGNINLFLRPVVKNDDGSISTVLSMSFYDPVVSKEVLIPRVVWQAGRGIVVSEERAKQHYYSTGKHLGQFNTVQDAETAAQLIHEQQQSYYAKGKLYYLIIPGVWSDGTSPKIYDAESSLTKYQTTGSFLAKCETVEYATIYVQLLLEQQALILKQRFGSGTYTDIA